MKSFTFFKFSPAGNDTVFLEAICPETTSRTHYGAMALSALGGEQAAFADTDNHILTMAGGEFCANASRAFGALLDIRSKGKTGLRYYRATINGIDIALSVAGSMPQWRVNAGFVLKNVTITSLAAGVTLVSLPGIDHILLETSCLPECAEAPEKACATIKDHGLWNKNAVGAVWWRENGDRMDITPFVRVAQAGTAMVEGSCGSATLALAIAQRREVLAMQPSGNILSATWDNGVATVGGPVTLQARGRIWLPEKP